MRMETITTNTDDGQSNWQIFVQTTDCGSNELACRRIHEKLFHESSPKTLFFSIDCNEHAVHLSVLGALREVEQQLIEFDVGWKYFSSCAMLANVLRDNCREFFKTFQTHFGTQQAMRCARTLFPKCIAGRWGSIHMFEDRLLQCGKEKL